MTELQLEPLMADDITPFSGEGVAVRIFNQKDWFVGLTSYISYKFGHDCLIRLNPFATFIPTECIDPIDPFHIGNRIVSPVAKITGDLNHDQPPFVLQNPQKFIGIEDLKETLIIKADRKVAVLSLRQIDIAAVNVLLEIEA